MTGLLAIVPARSGSKGLVDKNVALLAGEPLIARAVRCVLAADLGAAVVVSTDSPAYAEVARRAGALVPSLRPEALSNDDAPAAAVLEHVVAEYERGVGGPIDEVLWVEPTSPLRRPDDLRRGMEALRASGADTVVAVSPVPAAYHPDKLLRCDDFLRHHRESGRGISRRQELEGSFFVRNGVCYVLGARAVREGLGFITERTVPLVIDRPVANIDDELDLRWAHFLVESEPAW